MTRYKLIYVTLFFRLIISTNSVPYFNFKNVQNLQPLNKPKSQCGPPRLDGIRLEGSKESLEFEDDGIPQLHADKEGVLQLFGINFVSDMLITFTTKNGSRGDNCKAPISKEFSVLKKTLTRFTTQVKVNLPPLPEDADAFYTCFKEASKDNFIHQGSDYWLQVAVDNDTFPLWARILVIIVCLSGAFLMSGLNLGLMALDQTELRILSNAGTPKEKKYAATILPVRRHGNYLLCSIVLGNVLMNSIFTVFLDELTTGAIAIIMSTICITILAEIMPQAVVSRFNLLIGAKTIWITKSVMILSFPLSYPMAKLLNWMLGEDIGMIYNRERLKELISLTPGGALGKDEINIISGVLELHKKTVGDVMTKIEDVYMLDYDTILDFDTVSDITRSGYSRIPVYQDNRSNIVNILFIKDLAFVDPDDNTPLKTLCQFYQNQCTFIFEDMPLDVMFNIFKNGRKGHMAFVQRLVIEDLETIGLITLEDVIEELIQAEIMDETDVLTDNRTKRRRLSERRSDFSVFAEKHFETNKTRVSPPLLQATFYFLRNSVPQFYVSEMTDSILWRLLKQNVFFRVKKSKNWKIDPACVIYHRGFPADYFVLILEGRVEVTIGKENITLRAGPFMYFGVQALVQISNGAASTVSLTGERRSTPDFGSYDSSSKIVFQPDYSVRASTDVVYLKIKSSLYLAAKKAFAFGRSSEIISESIQDH